MSDQRNEPQDLVDQDWLGPDQYLGADAVEVDGDGHLAVEEANTSGFRAALPWNPELTDTVDSSKVSWIGTSVSMGVAVLAEDWLGSLSFPANNTGRVNLPTTENLVDNQMSARILFYYPNAEQGATTGLLGKGRTQQDGWEVTAHATNIGTLEIRANRSGTEQLQTITTTLSSDAWHYLVIIADGNRDIRIWIDGVESISESFHPHTIMDSNEEIIFGGRHHDNNLGYVGNIEEVVFYNRVISAAEAESWSNGNDLADGTDLVGQWVMHEGSGSTVTDIIGTKDGAITGADWAPGESNYYVDAVNGESIPGVSQGDDLAGLNIFARADLNDASATLQSTTLEVSTEVEAIPTASFDAGLGLATEAQGYTSPVASTEAGLGLGAEAQGYVIPVASADAGLGLDVEAQGYTSPTFSVEIGLGLGAEATGQAPLLAATASFEAGLGFDAEAVGYIEPTSGAEAGLGLDAEATGQAPLLVPVASFDAGLGLAAEAQGHTSPVASTEVGLGLDVEAQGLAPLLVPVASFDAGLGLATEAQGYTSPAASAGAGLGLGAEATGQAPLLAATANFEAGLGLDAEAVGYIEPTSGAEIGLGLDVEATGQAPLLVPVASFDAGLGLAAEAQGHTSPVASTEAGLGLDVEAQGYAPLLVPVASFNPGLGFDAEAVGYTSPAASAGAGLGFDVETFGVAVGTVTITNVIPGSVSAEVEWSYTE